MQKTVQDLGKLKRSISVEVPYEEMKPAYDRVTRRLKSIPVNGFRPGKHPKGWLDKNFHDYMAQECVKHVVPKYYGQILDELEWTPATQPTLEELEFNRKSPLKFQVSLELKPTPTLPDYEKLQLEKKEVTVAQEDVEENIKNLRTRKASFEAKEGDDLTVQEKDIVSFNQKGTIEGESFKNSDIEENLIEVNSEADPVFSPQFLGMKKGETKKFDYTYPEDAAEDLAGKVASYEIELLQIKELVLPEIDEAFLKEAGNFENEEAFRSSIEENLKRQKENEARYDYHDSISQQLDELCEEFDLPEGILADLEKKHTDDLREKNEGISEEDLKSQVDDYLVKVRKEMRTEYILDAIAKAENITPTEEDVAQRFISYCMMLQRNPNEVVQEPGGQVLYDRAKEEVYKMAVLDFLTNKTLGIEPEEQDAPEASAEEVVSEEETA